MGNDINRDTVNFLVTSNMLLSNMEVFKEFFKAVIKTVNNENSSYEIGRKSILFKNIPEDNVKAVQTVLDDALLISNIGRNNYSVIHGENLVVDEDVLKTPSEVFNGTGSDVENKKTATPLGNDTNKDTVNFLIIGKGNELHNDGNLLNKLHETVERNSGVWDIPYETDTKYILFRDIPTDKAGAVRSALEFARGSSNYRVMQGRGLEADDALKTPTAPNMLGNKELKRNFKEPEPEILGDGSIFNYPREYHLSTTFHANSDKSSDNNTKKLKIVPVNGSELGRTRQRTISAICERYGGEKDNSVALNYTEVQKTEGLTIINIPKENLPPMQFKLAEALGMGFEITEQTSKDPKHDEIGGHFLPHYS